MDRTDQTRFTKNALNVKIFEKNITKCKCKKYSIVNL